MSIFEEVRKLVDDANWRYRIHDGFDVRPIDTYKQIVSKADRNVQRYFGPFRSYIPKRSEWKFALEKYSKPKISQKHLLNIKTDINKAESEFNLVPTYRKLNKFPTSTSRLDNYNLYCRGRLHGVFGIGALFYPSNFIGEEDRRYERIYWGQDWMDYITPTARHATSLILSAY
ncbi:hypothetical protein DINM_003181 [Dirofilaria immitis]|nr:hypothetical protein [Dirofilaria immitis]